MQLDIFSFHILKFSYFNNSVLSLRLAGRQISWLICDPKIITIEEQVGSFIIVHSEACTWYFCSYCLQLWLLAWVWKDVLDRGAGFGMHLQNGVCIHLIPRVDVVIWHVIWLMCGKICSYKHEKLKGSSSLVSTCALIRKVAFPESLWDCWFSDLQIPLERFWRWRKMLYSHCLWTRDSKCYGITRLNIWW